MKKRKIIIAIISVLAISLIYTNIQLKKHSSYFETMLDSTIPRICESIIVSESMYKYWLDNGNMYPQDMYNLNNSKRYMYNMFDLEILYKNYSGKSLFKYTDEEMMEYNDNDYRTNKINLTFEFLETLDVYNINIKSNEKYYLNDEQLEKLQTLFEYTSKFKEVVIKHYPIYENYNIEIVETSDNDGPFITYRVIDKPKTYEYWEEKQINANNDWIEFIDDIRKLNFVK